MVRRTGDHVSLAIGERHIVDRAVHLHVLGLEIAVHVQHTGVERSSAVVSLSPRHRGAPNCLLVLVRLPIGGNVDARLGASGAEESWAVWNLFGGSMMGGACFGERA